VTTEYSDLPYRRSPVPVGSESYRVPASAIFATQPVFVLCLGARFIWYLASDQLCSPHRYGDRYSPGGQLLAV
jgi:hypothetical protein